jgi:hypothetical protein
VDAKKLLLKTLSSLFGLRMFLKLQQNHLLILTYYLLHKILMSATTVSLVVYTRPLKSFHLNTTDKFTLNYKVYLFVGDDICCSIRSNKATTVVLISRNLSKNSTSSNFSKQSSLFLYSFCLRTKTISSSSDDESDDELNKLIFITRFFKTIVGTNNEAISSEDNSRI